MYHIFNIYSSAYEHLAWFHFQAIVIVAALIEDGCSIVRG